jgi:hypothetical protein
VADVEGLDNGANTVADVLAVSQDHRCGDLGKVNLRGEER